MVHRHVVLVTLVACSSPVMEQQQPDAFLFREPSPAQAPWKLTASDGSGLEIVRVDAKAVVEGPLAFTELHLYFHNAENRTREGRFAITLPNRAAVSRFAMEIDGRLQEAEVVPKQRARQVFEDFLHRKQDPALLEKSAGNEFTARVFPIPPLADKHLVISFSQELAGEYVLPLRGLPTVEQVDVHLEATRLDGSRATRELRERRWRPDRDFTAGVATTTAVGAGGLIAMQIAPDLTTVQADPPVSLTLLVDTSASRALGFMAYVDSVGELVHKLHARYGEITLRVLAFDQEVQAIYEGPSSQFGSARAALLARGAAGASDLGYAMAWAAGFSTHQRIVVVTDGVVTAGVGQAELVSLAARADRIDVVLAGGLRDDQLAATLARGGKRAGHVLDLDRGASGVAIGLGERAVDVPITVTGASWVYPQKLRSVRAGGDPVTVFARVAASATAVDVAIGSDHRTLAIGRATPALIERAIAGAEIAELEERVATAGDGAAALRSEIATRSVAARVVSSETAMLVLEFESDYVRFGIDRRSLADILVVGERGIETHHRAFMGEARIDEISDDVPSLGGIASLTATESFSSGFDTQNVYGPLWGDGEGGRVGFDRDAGESGNGAAMKLDDGMAGRSNATRVEGQFRIDRSRMDPRLTRQQAIEQARTAGFLGASRFDTGNERGGTFGSGRSGFGPGGPGATYLGARRAIGSDVSAVTLGQPTASGDLDKAIIRRYIKRNLAKISYCYEAALFDNPSLAGDVVVQFTIRSTGIVEQAVATGLDATVAACIADVIRHVEFPRPRGNEVVLVRYPFSFRLAGADEPRRKPVIAELAVVPPPEPEPELPPLPPPPEPPPAPRSEQPGVHNPALTGKLAEVMDALATKSPIRALLLAQWWHAESPGDVLALIALGEALEANGEPARAARIYGSIIDLFPSRADLRRFAGQRLERVAAHDPRIRALAIDTYRRAVADRPDHVTGHRLLAHALLRAGDHAGAFAAVLAGVDRRSTTPGADRILREDAGIIASAYLAHGGRRAVIDAELARRKIAVASAASTRFILYWETDANDVDFHIRDDDGNTASYAHRALASGGSLYADVTTGYGPECFAIPGTPTAGPYHLSLHYYSQGPMGYGMGLLQIERFDGKGGVTFEDRPYVIMVDRAYVDLGTVR